MQKSNGGRGINIMAVITLNFYFKQQSPSFLWRHKDIKLYLLWPHLNWAIIEYQQTSITLKKILKVNCQWCSVESTGALELYEAVISIWYFSVTSSQLLHFIMCNPLISSSCWYSNSHCATSVALLCIFITYESRHPFLPLGVFESYLLKI